VSLLDLTSLIICCPGELLGKWWVGGNLGSAGNVMVKLKALKNACSKLITNLCFAFTSTAFGSDIFICVFSGFSYFAHEFCRFILFFLDFSPPDSAGVGENRHEAGESSLTQYLFPRLLFLFDSFYLFFHNFPFFANWIFYFL
jgi:hypothetical protein